MALNHNLIKLLNPKHTALLVIDIQKGYCDPNEVLPIRLKTDTDKLQALIPRLSKFVEIARPYGIKIIWTRMIEDPNYVPENLRLKMSIKKIPALTTPDKSGFDYYHVKPVKGDKQIVKKHYNAFTGTSLNKFLKHKRIKTLVLIGAYTSRCVDSTALVASDVLGYHVFVVKDFVGVPRKFESESKGILSRFDSILGYVVKAKDVKSAWASHKNL